MRRRRPFFGRHDALLIAVRGVAVHDEGRADQRPSDDADAKPGPTFSVRADAEVSASAAALSETMAKAAKTGSCGTLSNSPCEWREAPLLSCPVCQSRHRNPSVTAKKSRFKPVSGMLRASAMHDAYGIEPQGFCSQTEAHEDISVRCKRADAGGRARRDAGGGENAPRKPEIFAENSDAARAESASGRAAKRASERVCDIWRRLRAGIEGTEICVRIGGSVGAGVGGASVVADARTMLRSRAR